MELQLGLALPTHHDHIEGLDLEGRNIGLTKSKQVECSELWRPSCSNSSEISRKHFKNKRSFEDYSFGNPLKTLPLLVWSGQPNEGDDHSGKKPKNNHNSNKNEDDENRLVGWPPIKSWRKKELHQHQYVAAGGQIRNNNNRVLLQPANDAENQSRVPNSFYVKVNMEGVTIGRKINLRLYDSYQTLTNKLVTMFAKYQNFEEDGSTYTLTFQNEQGDWMLARHVPWQSFIGTVRRLAILRNEA